MKSCRQCNTGFEVTDADRAFYQKVSPEFNGGKCLIPEPTHCFQCRRQRRLAWQNMMNLYRRKCDFSGKTILSNISPEKKMTVYESKIWWSDEWDQYAAGRDFDFDRSFFEQFAELLKAAPVPNLFHQPVLDDNSEFTNYANSNKNCYLIFHANNNEDCLYGFGVKYSKKAVDVYGAFSSELLYECIDCENSYNLKFSQDCENCSDAYFLSDCIGCKNCIACHGLRNAEYRIFNQKVSPEVFQKAKRELESGSLKTVKLWQKKSEDWVKHQPHQAALIRQSENCSGDHIVRCQNVHDSFDVKETRDGRFLNRIFNGPNQDVYDLYQFGMKTELSYDCSVVGINVYGLRFCALCRNNVSNLMYCFYLDSSQNCFGCVGMSKKEYCILNKQYSKADYEALVPKIIEHMRQTGEWGEFFPMRVAPFAYNETMLMEHFPLSKEAVTGRGLAWKEDVGLPPEYEKVISAERLPDNIDEIPDDVLNWAIRCEKTGRLFKVTRPELSFYREHHLPIPRRHPNQRHLDRVEKRTPSKLFSRQCAQCQKPLQTTYSPERSEIVYCEACYFKEVY